jgi:hypothetical protein
MADLVGRRREMDEIERLLDAAESGHGAVIVIVGPPGAGKTAVLEHVAAVARERRVEVILADDADLSGGSVPASVDGSFVIATSCAPLGTGTELRLDPLSEEELAAAIGLGDGRAAHALWVASGGWPGPARRLAASLTGRDDPMVQLALGAPSRSWFLGVDVELIRLIEIAVEKATDLPTRARLLARLARELLGDASAVERRRRLAAEAVRLARESGDPAVQAETLDAQLGAVWDPTGAAERLETGAEIIRLARDAGELILERHGLFWRFVALMELGQVADAESVLTHFEGQATLAGDSEGLLMAKSRRGMLAAIRGRFDEAARVADEVLEEGRRIRLADAANVANTLRAMIMRERGDREAAEAGVEDLLRVARHDPGHFHEATAAYILARIGQTADATLELERVLPRVLTGTGPRWVGAMANLAFVAAAVGDDVSARRIYDRLTPFRGRLVVFGGAVMTMEPVSHYLGLLAVALGQTDAAVGLFGETIDLEEAIGALPFLAHSLEAYATALVSRGGAGDTEHAAALRRRSRSIAERLGMPLLLERLTPKVDEWRLTRDGDDWLLAAGTEHARLRDSRGLHYLRALLGAPGLDVPALELAGRGGSLAAPRAEAALDDAARRAFRIRITQLEEELERADRAGDSGRAERAETERQAILEELRRTSRLGGKPRLASPEAERARVNVTRTLRATLEQIAEQAPRAAAHLQASIRTGRTCRYQPVPGGPAGWSF